MFYHYKLLFLIPKRGHITPHDLPLLHFIIRTCNGRPVFLWFYETITSCIPTEQRSIVVEFLPENPAVHTMLQDLAIKAGNWHENNVTMEI